MKKIKSILIASNHLVQTGGTETYTYAIIKELLARGFDVEYFTFMKGDFSTKMEKELGVKFLSKKKYDLILANHNTCVEVLMGFGFIIQTCHGVYPPLEQPSLCANFHIAISQEVQNHLAIKGFVSVVIMNGIDTSKFYSKKNLNKVLKNVLSLCQSEDANKFLQRVCDTLGITLFYLNKNTNPVWNVEDLINDVDLVIGLGRSVYEAMACGRPVIVYDSRAYFESFSDGYVVNRLSTSLSHNCSGRFYKLKLTEEMMVDEFKKYNHLDGEILRNFILDDMTIKLVVDKYLNLNDSLQANLNNFKKNYFLKFIQRVFYVRIIKSFLKRN
ncbi:UDP-glycosyltransferase [Flavobacterium sp. GSP27]|uniref:UDP-glycosyltransferase n=1 Tax=Flavobacterium sp. GSP27 TaxID=2497489 RepID=UPI000F81FC6D|nr:UDP-glycosyltransferase [Flavobacterium sp. GSP27]RTZ07238.1 UDP-glycosyltransferase [Flavobacterium sp. GSP27]